MGDFKPLNTKKYHKTKAEVTPDTIYWKRLGSPTYIREFGAIDYIDFSPLQPFNFAMTCSVRVQIYNPITKLVVRNLSRFQKNAYGGNFRRDGRLLVAGDDEGLVKLFDTSSKNVLRLFKGHAGPVHRAFFTPDQLHISSFSDDRSVKLWDIATEKAVHTYAAHEDYIRAGAVNPASGDVIASGCYDGKIKMYDTRTQEVMHAMEHGAPVESLLFLPTGGILISAGGTEVCVWDAFAGCRLLTKVSQHHKTVTCLRLASEGKRILSGGLDRHVKIYDVASYQTVHTLEFPSPVLSLGISQDDQYIAAGMVDGIASLMNMEVKKSERDEDAEQRSRRRAHHFHRALKIDHEVPAVERGKEAKYNTHLRRYEYVKALDCVIARRISNRTPEITVSVLQELIHRKGLHRALTGRSNASLQRIISFIRRCISEYRFQRVLTDVANVLLDVYKDSVHEFSSDLGKEFLLLAQTVEKEVQLTYDLMEMQGAIEMLIDAARGIKEKDDGFHFVADEKKKVEQSKKAAEETVLRV